MNGIKSGNLAIIFFVILLACTVKVVMPAFGNASAKLPQVTDLIGMQFYSCDKKLGFSLTDKNNCFIDSVAYKGQSPCTLVGDGLPDLNLVLKNCLKSKELWYVMDKDGVIDPAGTLLYPSDASEFKIVNQMWWYAEFAQKRYKDKHRYPFDADASKASNKNFEYLNPFTLKQDSAAILPLKGLSADPSWVNRPPATVRPPHWRPGGIYCVNIRNQRFYIHGFDRDGVPLTSADPKRYFVIECFEGNNLTSKALKESDDKKSSNSDPNQRILVCGRKEQIDMVKYLRSLSCIAVWFCTIVGALWTLLAFVNKQGHAHKALCLAILLTGLTTLAGWYALAYGLI